MHHALSQPIDTDISHSNGIRLSITDLAPPLTRVLPTVYSYRNKISLYEAQYDDDGEKIPLPASIMEAVVAMLLRFQVFCAEFRVPPSQIRVVATEATRKAINSEEFLRKVLDETGLSVEILSQNDEGEVGAWGIASSVSAMRGLVMDLGGGSTQITWMVTKEGSMQTSHTGAISFPYGAAALTAKLKNLKKGKSNKEARKAEAEFREEVESNLEKAYHDLKLPADLIADAEANGGFSIYLTGGGFRGWGYLLLHQSQVHGKQYPISIINGYTVQKEAFQDAESLKKVAKSAHKIFRVSDRRREQVPAVAFLINALAEAIPNGIRDAHFCQGGVREGILFQQLPLQIRAQNPLEVATKAFARPLAGKLSDLLLAALPDSPGNTSAADPPRVPEAITGHIVRATANMFYVHSNMSKESSSTSALYTTSTGLLSSAHGLSHVDRALLALILEARYEGELAPREDDYRAKLRRLLSDEEVWWTIYLGRVGLVLSRVYPAGSDGDEHDGSPALRKPEIELSARWQEDGTKNRLQLVFGLRWHSRDRDEDPMRIRETLESHAKVITKAGKKKHAINGWRIPIEVVVRDVDQDQDQVHARIVI